MPWPSTPTYDTTALDNGGDTLQQARAAILGAVTDVIAMIAMRGVANGVASLGADGKVPAGQLNDLSGYLTDPLTALSVVAAEADKLPYFTGNDQADVCAFPAFARTLLAASSASAARTALGLALGTDVQAFSALLATITTLLSEAETVGVLRKTAEGVIALDDAAYISDVDLASYASIAFVNDTIAALRSEADPFDQYIGLDDIYGLFATEERVDDIETALSLVGTGTLPPFPTVKPPGARLLAENDVIATSYAPWVNANIGTGSISALTADSTHNGVAGLKGGTVSGDGARIMTGTGAIVLRGGSMYEAVMSPTTVANETVLLGFMDTQTAAAHSNAVAFKMSPGGSVAAITANNGTTTTAGTTFSPTVGTYYVYRITVAAAFASVRFQITTEAGVSQYDVTLSTNLPTANGVGCGIVCTTTATNSPTIVSFDVHRVLLY